MPIQCHGLIQIILKHIKIIQPIRLLVIMMPITAHSSLELRRRCMLRQTKQVIRCWKGKFHTHAHWTKWLGIGMFSEFLLPHVFRVVVFFVETTLFPPLALVHAEFFIVGAIFGGRGGFLSCFLARAIGVDGKSIFPVSHNFFPSMTIIHFFSFFFIVTQFYIKVIYILFSQFALAVTIAPLNSRALLTSSNFKVCQTTCPGNNHGWTIIIATKEIDCKWL
mmetsp:Transcript_13616/g.29627  ORF Transcript_13616/g.29627 Transcript_13616/m.29627 type:complete len:221 (+) Transcript_13616:2087-2749(+)